MPHTFKFRPEIKIALLLIPFWSGGIGCTNKKSAPEDSVSSKAIPAYCPYLPSNTYANPITVSGNAVYEYRKDGNGVSANGQGGNPSPNPIRYAEIRVTSATGALVQCGETDASGNFSFQLDQSTGTHTISVWSRANNGFAKAYVLTTPTANELHSIQTTVEASSNTTGLSLTASSVGNVEGGAFNILDQIVKANDYLRAQLAAPHCGTTFTECPVFTVAPIVYAYWSKGVNPGTYFGMSGGISFYLPGRSELYLMGGLNGDVDSSDTDHFDNSVILHEYAHFLEDVFGKSDSPGGSHSGNAVIDPRLAWGEGWANFFQAAVTGSPVYRDTYGNPTGNAGAYFSENIESGTSDVAANNGEGVFREFSVSRILWDSIDDHPASYTFPNTLGVPTTVNSDNDAVDSPFAELWAVFAGTTTGFNATNRYFRSIALLHLVQTGAGNANNWSSLRTAEKHRNDLRDYANPLTVGGAACAAITMTPTSTSSGSYAASHQLLNNDFYYYYHTGGSLAVTMTYTNANIASPSDFDLYIYKNDYLYGRTSDMAGTSNASGSSSGGTETISKSLAAGPYIINVMAYTGGGPGAGGTYSLTINGQAACPTY